jgi:hypothetical protein
MLKRLTAAHAAILIAAAFVVACGSEQALLVSPRVDGAPPLGVVNDSSGAPVRPVSRDVALPNDESWSFDVDPSGAKVRYPSVGLTIDIPAGAVAAPTRITCIALRGAALAYRFEPHGLQFAKPVTLTQTLHGLRLDASSLGMPALIGGYFADDSLVTDAATGSARVKEILPVQIDVRGHKALLQIHHFSGYTVASAFGDSLSFSDSFEPR